MKPVTNSKANLQLLSALLLTPSSTLTGNTLENISRIGHHDLEPLSALAVTNHVILRSFEPLQAIFVAQGKKQEAEWVSDLVLAEKRRIDHATRFLHEICSVLEQDGCPVTVIKSLDHWPDLGSDLDLYTDADADKLLALMKSHFNAKVADRSWGDRLANKWNFIISGLPELVEVHVGRLGQTGEQTAITRSLSARAYRAQIGSHTFRVTAPEDRIVVSTLQRMYRHFYIRLCDIVDNVGLWDAERIDFDYLHKLGSSAGLWDGIATYLTIISEYVAAYRGFTSPLPSLITASARFGSADVCFRKDFLRVPILPHSLSLYAAQLKSLVLSGDLRNSLRLSLLPGLATAAALEQKLTGSDKGIW